MKAFYLISYIDDQAGHFPHLLQRLGVHNVRSQIVHWFFETVNYNLI